MRHEAELFTALERGDPDTVARLIAAGVDVRSKNDDGYGALLVAVHGRDIVRDTRLLDLLRLLVDNGADLDPISAYNESALRVLSRLGRFDAVRVLLDAGADENQLQWTPLIKAVGLGSLADVERLARENADLEETDWWSRTAWLVALLAGDLAKAKLLRDLGANVDARGRCGATPLSYAVAGRHPEVVIWLIDSGQEVDQVDDFGATPLMEAVECADLECVDLLIAAGADLDRDTASGSVLGTATTKEVARRLLDAGADPRLLSQEGHRALCGLPDAPQALAGVSKDEARRARTRVFGAANPERMREPFWEAMIRSGVSGYQAAQALDLGSSLGATPVWCAQRFGQSITFLPDGRIVQIGGEHEDHYDPDFCIYNDAFVHGTDGSIAIFGYPAEVFPPTDFHTATLIDDAIYVIGGLGYNGARQYGQTPVYRLDLATLSMNRLDTSGEAPGWIYSHRADVAGPGEIRVSGGTLVTAKDTGEIHAESSDVFVLDVKRAVWRRERQTS
jgi:ankyrin repeat protein